jgi:hypothetical protein
MTRSAALWPRMSLDVYTHVMAPEEVETETVAALLTDERTQTRDGHERDLSNV